LLGKTISSLIPLDQQELAEQKDDEINNRGVLQKLFFDDSFPLFVIKDSSTSSGRIKLLIVGLRIHKIQRPRCKGAKQPEGRVPVTGKQCAEAERHPN
jgi:hypothetical protein